MMQSGSVPHALLFAGPKGTGKTSAARIVSAMLNDPANAEIVDAVFFGQKNAGKKEFQDPNSAEEIVQRIQRGTSYVVNEIDAASYRGIDDIRQLKERVYLPPQEGKVSVYILDEVHMLTTEAFNSLLKILEEPPVHVVFILATTELHKIPPTIASRSTLIQFQRASEQELSEALERVLKQEKITYDKEAVSAVAAASEGSFRDAIKLLETVAAGQKKLSVEDVAQYLQQTHQQDILNLLDAIVAKQEKEVVVIFQRLRNQATDPQFFYKALLQFLHQDLLTSIAGKESHFTTKISHYLLTQLQTIGSDAANIPFLSLELKALELVFKAKEKNGTAAQTSSPILKMEKKILLEPEVIKTESENWIHG